LASLHYIGSEQDQGQLLFVLFCTLIGVFCTLIGLSSDDTRKLDQCGTKSFARPLVIENLAVRDHFQSRPELD
jgi:hypothetical protein